jgi:cytochrome bd-type quinol oxidase subunit 2
MAMVSAYCVLDSEAPIAIALSLAASSTIAAALLGFAFGSWYLPTDNESPSFELFAVPALVSFLALLLGSVPALAVLLATDESRAIGVALAAGVMAFVAAAIHFSTYWPITLSVFTIAGLVMALIAGYGPNHSLKRTNQSLRD